MFFKKRFCWKEPEIQILILQFEGFHLVDESEILDVCLT